MSDVKKVTASREENTEYLNQILPVKESFDIIKRDIMIGGRCSTFYSINGFANDESLLKIMDSFSELQKMICLEMPTASQENVSPMWRWISWRILTRS